MNARSETHQVQPGHYDDSQEEGRVVISNLTALQSAEIDQQISTARAYPRSLTQFRKNVLEQCTLDPVIAGKCIYALSRDNKVIEGPSVRFAEILATCWGNNRHGARVVDIGEEFLTAQGFFHDLENNMAITFEVLRRITTKSGARYSQDMIMVTGNAAASIALRNAVTRGIPQAFWAEPLEAARKVIAGDTKTLNTRRLEMLKQFAIFGVKPEQIYGLLGVEGPDDVSLDNLVTLAGLITALREGDTTVEDTFAGEKKDGVATPARPKQSEFTRDAQATELKEGEKVAPKTAESTPAAGAGAAAGAAAELTLDDKAPVADRKADRRKAMELYLSERVSDLSGITSLRQLGNLADEVEAQLDPDLVEGWGKAVDARQKTIMEAARTKK